MKIDQEAVRPDNSQTAAQLYPDVSYYTLADIEMAFVPLYDRMYLTFRSIAARVNELLDSQQTDQNRTSSQKIPPYGFPAKCCYRMYITSSNSLKKEAFNNREMNEQLKGIIIGSVLPRFVWCVDISTLDEYNSNLISARIVIDTTENSNELNPWLIIHDREKVVYYGEDGKWAIIDQDNQGRVLSIQPYGAYINNLAHIKKIEVKS